MLLSYLNVDYQQHTAPSETNIFLVTRIDDVKINKH